MLSKLINNFYQHVIKNYYSTELSITGIENIIITNNSNKNFSDISIILPFKKAIKQDFSNKQERK